MRLTNTDPCFKTGVTFFEICEAGIKAKVALAHRCNRECIRIDVGESVVEMSISADGDGFGGHYKIQY